MVYKTSLLSMFLCFTHMKILLKMFGVFFFFSSYLAIKTSGRNKLGTVDDNALCSFLLYNPGFMVVCLSQESAGLKK